MNQKIKDVQSEVFLRVVHAREELLGLQMELENNLLDMEDIRQVSSMMRASLQSEVRKAYEELINRVQEAAG